MIVDDSYLYRLVVHIVWYSIVVKGSFHCQVQMETFSRGGISRVCSHDRSSTPTNGHDSAIILELYSISARVTNLEKSPEDRA
jgi:hypothetical protein